MRADEIRARFLDFFARHGHTVVPSSPLVPADDPTLLFTNAGMVQFKRVFLGLETRPYRRAATAQKCVRAGGKHNDLEQVGRTPRHHTFFEMLGNFSFGDYFKREAIGYAWTLLTEEFGLPADRLWVTVHERDDEAEALWQAVAGVPKERIFRLGDKDNFWQMAETGPCGPCSEIHFDLRPEAERNGRLDRDAFVALGERGDFLEIWNLVFMQFDRAADGTLEPLPAPSIDTGAGLERLASVLQGVRSNYDTDLFRPLLERIAAVLGRPYQPEAPEGVSFRVLADHARAVAFLLADGVYPSNEGRGYVLRRILRRAVRHAWLLGRREPTLVEVVAAVVDAMGHAYPELPTQRDFLLRTTRAEEERFLATIEEGLRRFDEIAPPGGRGVISGADAFRLYDTYGFPLDLTELMAAERGYSVDVVGFERELEAQRRRSREDWAAAARTLGEEWAEGWEWVEEGEQTFVGYERTEVETDVLAFRRQNGRVALVLRANPFYVEGGGQVSDRGRVRGDGWAMEVDEVRRIAGQVAVIGNVEGTFRPGRVVARVEEPRRRDTERNHTATHLLHAALRSVLGPHVRQQGSLVAPERLQFDFSHPEPLTEDQRAEIERWVNEAILANHEVRIHHLPYGEALRRGAIALFGEKYGDVVRVVEVPGVSMELCGGTHVRTTGQIGLFLLVSESGVAAGVRRIEAVTGHAALQRVREQRAWLQAAAAALRTAPEHVPARVQELQAELRDLARRLEKARRHGAGDGVAELLDRAVSVRGIRVIAARVTAADTEELRALGDRVRERLGRNGVAVLAADLEDGKTSWLATVTDNLVAQGLRADELVRRVAALTGGRGGGRPHLALAGVGDAARIDEALRRVPEVVESLVPSGHAGTPT